MKISTFLFALTILLILLTGTGSAQTQEPPSRFEVGAQFSSISYPETSAPFGALASGVASNEAGFGGRFTFNLNRHFALEAEGNFFPHHSFANPATYGRLLQGQFGLKAGKRFRKFGLFAKARPGVTSFSDAIVQVDSFTFLDFNGNPITVPVFGVGRVNNFSLDLGGVVEFYPSQKWLTRIDVGDTIIHHGDDSFSQVGIGLAPGPGTTHNLQITAGLGFRLGNLQPDTIASTGSNQHSNEHPPRFEVGAQFSSLLLSEVEHTTFFVFQPVFPDRRDTVAQAGFGGRFTFNLNRSFALEAQTDFYPMQNGQLNNGRAGGRVLQTQAGVKVGKRFENFGIFAKARPGVVSFGQAVSFDGFSPIFGFPFFRPERKTYFSTDVGGVLEFYPSRRVMTRFDFGDTMIRYRAFEVPINFFPVQFFHTPAETLHNFQFSAGVGFRF